jgi:hypothetical protein
LIDNLGLAYLGLTHDLPGFKDHHLRQAIAANYGPGVRYRCLTYSCAGLRPELVEMDEISNIAFRTGLLSVILGGISLTTFTAPAGSGEKNVNVAILVLVTGPGLGGPRLASYRSRHPGCKEYAAA